MRDDSTLPFLARWRRPSRHAPREQEPADLGTAFGLEATLEASLGQEAGDAAAAPRDAGWLQRWRSGLRQST